MEQCGPSGIALRNITAGTVLLLATGYLLFIGQGVIIPILVALISVYVMSSLDQVLSRWKITSWAPQLARRLILTLVFIGLLVGFTSLVVVTIQQLLEQASRYQENIKNLIAQGAHLFGVEKAPDWETIEQATLGSIDLKAAISNVASQLSSVGGMILLTIIYMAFLFGEKARLGEKLTVAFPNSRRTEHTLELVNAINSRIGQYLGTKTLINIILGVISWLIMASFGLDYAPFWALLIGLLNYIPYIGSIVALVLPVGLSIVQFAAWPTVLGMYACLQTAQILVGNFLEPTMVGRRVNLSPFWVLAALAIWGALWGILGMILAVPLTSMMVIIFNEIPTLRPLSVMMSENVSEYDKANKLHDNIRRPWRKRHSEDR